MGVQEVEAARNVQRDPVPEAVPEQAAIRVSLDGAVQIATCSRSQQHICTAPRARYDGCVRAGCCTRMPGGSGLGLGPLGAKWLCCLP